MIFGAKTEEQKKLKELNRECKELRKELLAKATWTYVEKVFVGIFYHRDKYSFVHVVAVAFADINEVHHPVWDSLAFRSFVHGFSFCQHKYSAKSSE